MASAIFTSREYPFELPEAQQLHQVLTVLFPRDNAASLVAERTGLDTGRIFWGQAISYVWQEILKQAALWEKIADLIRESLKMIPPNNSSARFLNDLLSGAPLVLAGEPRNADGSPAFIHASDDITEPEALLYHDDLTMQVGRIPKLIATLGILLRLSPSVCRLTVSFGNSAQYGTAFRIGAQTLLTNWHVLHQKGTGIRTIAATAEFGYEDNGEGGVLTARNFPCNVDSIVTSQENDWAIITVNEQLDPEWEIVPITYAETPKNEQPAYIIQHPLGDRKRFGFVRNQISAVDTRIIQYMTDTQVGSSGAPVFDEEGRLIAIHHAAGRPQEIAGRPPVKKNEGIRISQVLADLKARGVPGF